MLGALAATGGLAACKWPPSASRGPYFRWSDSVSVYAVVRTVWNSVLASGGSYAGSRRVVPQPVRQAAAAMAAGMSSFKSEMAIHLGLHLCCFCSKMHPMSTAFATQIDSQLADIRQRGLYKTERVIASPQNAHISTADGREVLNFCANNYLGLADHPAVIAAAHAALDRWGFGLASVRFICGTQEIHKELEDALSRFLGMADTILYPSCFDANGGLFETLLTAEDAVISDELNHASIIDGIRLCKARRFRYKNNDLADLEAQLVAAASARCRLIATDGVFSMDGTIANLAGICDLAEKHGALVMFDDCHAAGFLGRTGRGTHEHCGVMDRVDIITGTLGKALGGASGGYISASKPVVELLRQRSRPYLFSNSVAPCVVAASLKAIELLSADTTLRDRLETSTAHFRAGLTAAGLTIKPGTHPIVPVMLGDAALSQRFAARMLEKGVYVVGFFYPVVPEGTARIRTQVSAAHTPADLDMAIGAFAEVKAELGI
jgi:glycine C-acetyltransferase